MKGCILVFRPAMTMRGSRFVLVGIKHTARLMLAWEICGVDLRLVSVAGGLVLAEVVMFWDRPITSEMFGLVFVLGRSFRPTFGGWFGLVVGNT